MPIIPHTVRLPSDSPKQLQPLALGKRLSYLAQRDHEHCPMILDGHKAKGAVESSRPSIERSNHDGLYAKGVGSRHHTT